MYMPELLDLLDGGLALPVEGPGVDPLQAGPGLDLLEGLAAAPERGQDALAVLHHEPEVEHGR